ncbi:aspartyl protease [Hanseniaspora uvarum]|nr:aspartyl protease [Hanseniaspora uvarum]
MTVNKVLLTTGLLMTTLEASEFIQFPLTKGKSVIDTKEVRDADDNLQFTITNEQSYYSVELTIGSDNQKLTALLDTGSSDLWVLGKDLSGLNACDNFLEQNGYLSSSGSATSGNSEEVSEIQANCEDLGVFSPSSSKSFKKQHTNVEFEIQYGDLTYAEGYWGSDSLNVNGVNVDGLLFGVATIGNSSNVLGISFEGLESSDQSENYNSDFTYANLPAVLKQDGLIEKKSYSLFLNSLSATSGELLFGAVDADKYQGGLYTVPLVNIYEGEVENPIEFDVTLQGTGYSGSDGTEVTFNQQNFAALFDSGTTLTVLPEGLVNSFAEQIGATYDYESGYYLVDCQTFPESDAFVFQFGGVNFYSPVQNYILNTSDESQCFLGIVPASDNHAIIGDNTLTSLYVVYNLEDYELSIAQANYAGASSNSISAISDSVPGAQQAPGYSNTAIDSNADVTSGGNIFSGSQPTNPFAKRDVVKRDSSNSTTLATSAATSSQTTGSSSSSANAASKLTFGILGLLSALLL